MGDRDRGDFTVHPLSISTLYLTHTTIMKFAGSVTVKAPQTALWSFLVDPQQITRCVPNLKWWDSTADPNHYLAEIFFRWGDKSVAFESDIIWQNLVAPKEGMMAITGRSKKSNFTANSQMTLAPVLTNMTQINWQVEATLTGRLAEFPETFVKTAALININRFFKNVKNAFDS